MKKKKASFGSVSDKLEPIFLVLNPNDNRALRDLVNQLECNSHSLEAIEAGLQEISVGPQTMPEKNHQEKSSLFKSFYSGKKHDKVQDKRSVEDKKQVQDSPVFQDEDDSSDENNPYARIDILRKKILQERPSNSSSTLLPPGGGGGGDSKHQRPLSISGQVFDLPGQQHKSTPSLTNPALYRHMEEVVPSPFLDRDMVRTYKYTYEHTDEGHSVFRAAFVITPLVPYTNALV